LNDADLVRLYTIERVELGFIPRWRQRLKIAKPRYPLPPEALRDQHINELISKMAATRQPHGRHMAAESESKGIESEKKQFPPELSTADGAASLKAPTSYAEFWTSKAKALGIEAHPGESLESWWGRARDAVKNQKP
jgi:hypothetical protein